MKNKFTFSVAFFLSMALTLFLNEKVSAQTYCTPALLGQYYSCSYLNIESFSTTGGTANITNNNSGCSTNNWGDNSATMIHSTMQGTSVNYSFSTNYNYEDGGVKIWVDWNADGDFSDAGETVYESGPVGTSNPLVSYGSTVTGSFFVPFSATVGTTRMRIRVVSYTNDFTACSANNNTDGETEDYGMTITAAPACSGQPVAGYVPAIMSVCANMPFTIVDTGATLAGNMIYQWQSRFPAGTGTWTNIAGASNFSYNASGISAATDYRFFVVCNGSSQSDTTSILPVVMNPPTQCYCTPIFGQTYDYISGFTTTGATLDINNINSGVGPNGYDDFTGTDTLQLTPGMTINFNTDMSSPWTQFAEKIWIDLDQNGDFYGTGEDVGQSPGTAASSPISGSFTVPLNATPGYTRLRVRAWAYPYPPAYPDPCQDYVPYDAGETEDYTVLIDPLLPCASVTFPTSVDAVTGNTTLCVSDDVDLSLDAAMPLAAGITYQWQSSPTGSAPWTNEGTAGIFPETTVTGVSTETYFQCEIACSGTVVLTSSSVHILINNPSLTSPTGGTRCGPGTVDLSATPGGGATLNWYQNSTGGLPLGTGSTFTCPYITATTDFYVAAAEGSTPVSEIIGTGVGTTNYDPSPFYDSWNNGAKNQYLVTAAELQAAGFGPGNINSIGFDVLGIGGTANLQDFTIMMGMTNSTFLVTSSWESGLTQVYTTASFTPTANSVNSFLFISPFLWDGESNIVIQTCFYTTTQNTGNSATVRVTSNNYDQYSHTILDYNGTPGFCAQTAGGGWTSYDYSRPNIIFDMDVTCSSPRQAVTATVTPGPAFAIDHDTVVCNNAVTQISVSSPTGNYGSYTWTPTDDLYTDAAANTPYTGGNASTVYFKSDMVGTHTFAVAASNGPAQSDCAAADTARIWVQPTGLTILGVPDTICGSTVNPATTLILNPNWGYAPGSIQWQESADGLSYTDIAGANSESFATPTLSGSGHYYKVLINAESGVCEAPEKHVLIANPSVVSTKDSFTCDPGTVTLEAVGGLNSSLVWYAEEAGGTPLGSGSPFVTPFLSVTDTFYVVGSGGMASSPGLATIGAGASTTNYEEFNPYYWNYLKTQYLITKDELNAAGIYGGPLTSLAFNVVNGGYDYNDFAISMGNTSAPSLNTTYETGLQQVSAPQYVNTSSGWNTYTFDNPFFWDGNSNVVIQVCWSNGTGGYADKSDVKYDNTTFTSAHFGLDYDNDATADAICAADATDPLFDYSGTFSKRPQMQFNFFGPCESAREPVIAHIYPNPVVDLGQDINECVDSGAAVVLDAGIQPNQPAFLWDNESSSQIRAVNTSGTYSVAVTNQYTCVGYDTINVILRNYPVVELGNDTTVCEGISVTLNAGDNGIQYFWNTGQNTSKITVDNSGSYAVLVTNAAGCVKADTINVTMDGQLPTMNGIQITNNAGYVFTFTALNPQNVTGYFWDFGDGSAYAYGDTVTHPYASAGNFLVTLVASSACGSVADSMAAHIVGIHDLSLGKEELSVYPNPTTERATILNKGTDIRMEQIEVFTILGKKVYSAKADSPVKHELSLSGFASGMYTIRIQTNKGTVARKLELIK